jgi:hypothetical protein
MLWRQNIILIRIGAEIYKININSREHRAFGGFSLGSVTTWHQFIFNNDIIKYIYE